MVRPAASSAPRPAVAPPTGLHARDRRRVLLAASAGTVFEWYDFFLFGVLAPVLAHHFFSPLAPDTATAFVLLLFAAGFLARPFGALLFGRIGDTWGRKMPFLVTLVVMGLSTAVVAVLPTHEQWGLAAPLCLVLQRLMQGLALGGEYGGAVTFVAESAPPGRRGAHTAWLQTTASAGLLMALCTVGLTRLLLGEAAFLEWGWRLPYALSAGLLLASFWVRVRLVESPVFLQVQAQGRTERSPLRALLATGPARRRLLLAVAGLTAGQAVLWYMAQVYAQMFVQGTVGMPPPQAMALTAVAIAAALPVTVLAGRWSDRVGRRPPMLAGLVLGAALAWPVFAGLQQLVDPATGPGAWRWWAAAGLLWLLGACVALVYGPLAAALAELFPSAVRYTGTSLAYHLGNGLFGGLLPAAAHLLVAATGHPLAGLAYPVTVSLLCAAIAWRWLPEGRDVDIAR